MEDKSLNEGLFRAKIKIALFVMILIALGVLWHIFNLQVVQQDIYQAKSQNNRLFLYGIEPNRGKIYDTNGEILAYNKTRFQLVASAAYLDETTWQSLSAFLPIDPNAWSLQKKPDALGRVVVLNDISDDVVAQFSARKHLYPSVWIAQKMIRVYPYGTYTSHVLGYIKTSQTSSQEYINLRNAQMHLTRGQGGLEKSMNTTLYGTMGQVQIERDAKGRQMGLRVLQPPVSGKNIYSTIDIRVQEKAHQALQGKKGVAVVLNARTGEILAAVSQPDFNPNLLSVSGYTSTLPKGAFFNRVTQGQYPPASTIKPFLGLAALELGLITMDEKIFSKGFYQLPNSSRKFRDWKKGGHGWIDLRAAIAQSSDDFFYELAYRLGISNIHDFLKKFHFGERILQNFTPENKGLLPSREWKEARFNKPWYIGETLINGIGQGYTLVTPIQLAAGFAALAMEGTYYQPTLVRHVQNSNTKKISSFKPIQPSVIQAKKQHWAFISQAMLDTIESPRGTANRLGNKIQYKMAGKTGTAQVTTLEQARKSSDKKFKDHALFAGFAPFEAPEFVVLVVLENQGGGSRYAAPIVREIMDFCMSIASRL